MFRCSSFVAVLWGLAALSPLHAQSDTVKLPTFTGSVVTEEFKVQGGTFDVISDQGERRTFEYNTPKAPRCVFYDRKAGRNLQPYQMGLGDEVIVAYTDAKDKHAKDKVYAVKVTRTKAAKHD
jgi:hypothetical protein